MARNPPRDGDRLKTFTRRAAVLGVAQASMISALVGRMYYLQIIDAEKYRTLSDENRISPRLLPPPRGRIVDRFGVPMAVNQQNFRVLIVSEQAEDVAATLDALSNLVPLSDTDRQRVIREIKRRRSFVQVPVRENLTWEEMARIQVNAPDLPGVFIDEGLARHYPMGNIAGHVLGYVAAVSENDLTGDPLLELPGFRIGKAGIERQYDKALRGSAGTSQVEVNALGRVIRELAREEGQPGAELQLTLDTRLQEYAYQALGEESGTVVVMDVRTGEIMAIASNPGYDPNAFNRGLTTEEWETLVRNPKSPLTNKPIAGQYAPGSTFKMVVCLAALEANVIKPEQTVFCPGYTELGNAKFHCWKKGGHGSVDMVGALKHSCDVYFYEVAKRLGIDRIAEMSNRLGLGVLTGVDMPGEKPGLIPTRAWKEATRGEVWHKGESLVAGIGQGYITTTPLQLATMVSRIANGGLGIKPRVTRALMVDRKSILTVEPPVDLGISRSALNIVHRGMWEVVNGPGGTAQRSKLPPELGVEMCGKTGTAQVRRISKAERESGVIKNEDLPWERRDHALFVCYAPADVPRYGIAVVIEHGGGGSAVAAPIARKVMLETLRLDPARATGEVASAGGATVRPPPPPPPPPPAASPRPAEAPAAPVPAEEVEEDR